MNFGHWPPAVIACPTEKSAPMPEYSIEPRLSAPMALDAFTMTVLASCAIAAHEKSVTSSAAVIHFLTILFPPGWNGEGKLGDGALNRRILHYKKFGD